MNLKAKQKLWQGHTHCSAELYQKQLAQRRSWKYKFKLDFAHLHEEAWEKWQMVGRSCTPATGVLCSHNQPSGGLTWRGSEHTVARIYSVEEKGEKIVDVGSLSSTCSPQVMSIAPICPPWRACGAGGRDSTSPYAFFCSWGMKCWNRNILAMPKLSCLNTGLSFIQPSGRTSLQLDFRTEPVWEPGLPFYHVSVAWRPAGQMGSDETQPTERRQKSSLVHSSTWHSLWRSLRHLVSHKYCREPWPCCETSV